MKYLLIAILITTSGCAANFQALRPQVPGIVDCLARCAGCVIELHRAESTPTTGDHIGCSAQCVDCCVEILQTIGETLSDPPQPDNQD
jgi:hypothetical protein